VDISTFAERIRDQRFDGYTDTGLADEIVKFQGGDGIGSISGAVDALKAVASALSDTDLTLRRELGKLGVDWQSTAGGKAGEVFTEKAGFSQDANDKVNHAAEMIFAQGEAFNRTLYKLPDPETVRKGAGGLTLGDSLVSLIGFETDHAAQVAAANDARGQTLEALNSYASDSGDYLSSAQTIGDPQSLQLAGGGGQDPMSLGGSAVDLGGSPETPVGGTGATVAAHTDTPASPPTTPFRAQSHVVAAPHDAPTPPMGLPVQAPPPRQTAPQPGGTAPSSATPPSTVTSPVTGGTGGYPVAGGMGSTTAPPEFVRPGTGVASGSPISDVLGNVSGATSSGAGALSAMPVSRSTGGASGAIGSEQALGQPRLMGSGPQAPTTPVRFSTPIAPVAAGGASAGELGAGATAIGAGGAGAAVSGERERQGRGFGSTAAGSGRPTTRLPIGELPEEEATAARNAGKLGSQQPGQNRGFMEPAAPQHGEGEDDIAHVRRFGVDDKDLFSDQRLVSPDLIRETGAEETD
jgi:hypothetical protein